MTADAESKLAASAKLIPKTKITNTTTSKSDAISQARYLRNTERIYATQENLRKRSRAPTTRQLSLSVQSKMYSANMQYIIDSLNDLRQSTQDQDISVLSAINTLERFKIYRN